MKRYKDRTGHSGVLKYESGFDYIKIRFKTCGKIYVYDHSVPGPFHVKTMKRLAEEGRGLSTYVSQRVRENFSRVEQG